ncbi:uncharacterized protein LOC105794567 isoform X2 [Gossypium raimondii]|uniref:Uncharacterized protein n=3 Tax=Gossypium raimondii TaxID=29730 RepID=A0A0D2NEH7_GOSRA|nr:uncharacterized protein LOC105794567 isoform X2 [Gossypium raimondii]KJB31037.1 hypothetical protein B456_005G174200 [Gossypium raimondii]
MEKPDSTSGCGCSDVYHSIFIDTNLDTHLAMIVSDSETVSDLKKKILYEHPLCFPNIGEIKINALKVKRKGFLYHLSDSMFVKSAFGGVSRSWFLSVDASSAKEHRENHNSIEPDAGNIVSCFGTGINNYSVDVVDLLPVDTAKRLSNVNDAPLPQDRDVCHAKQNSASQQFGFSNSTKENSENLCKEAEHTADSNNQVSFPATNTGSRPKVQSKDVGDDKISEDLQASVATSVLKQKQKTKKRNKYAIHHDSKVNGALVVESGKDALDSGRVLEENLIHNGPSLALNDANLGNQIHVDETSRSLSSDRNKRSTARKRMAVGGINVPGEHSELETNKHKDVAHKDQEHESKEDSFQSQPASKKKRKAEKKDVNDNSLIENGEQVTDLNTATSECTLGQKLENTSAVVDPLNTESVKQNHLSTANASGGKKNRKRQKSNPSQVGSEVSSAKDVHVETFQAVEAIKDKDLGSKGDPVSFLGKRSAGGEISEPGLISSMKMQEVSETNQVPQRNKYAIHYDSKENGALVVESGKDALDSGCVLEENLIHNGPSLALNDANLGSQIHVDETSRSLSSDRNKRSTARKKMADGGINLPGEHSELETNKHKNVAHKNREHESKEDSFQSRPVSKKKRKAEKKDVNDNSLIENGEHATDLNTATSECTLGQKLENTRAVVDPLNAKSVKQNHLSTANASGEKKNRKRQKSNPSQVGSEVSAAKDVHVETFQAVEAIEDKDLGSKGDPVSFLGKRSAGGEISEPGLISSMKMQEVSETNQVPHSGGYNDMDDTNDGNLKSKNEAAQPDVASAIKARDSYDQISSLVDGHPAPVSQEGIDFRKEFGVSRHGNQSGTLEEKIVEPKKSSKKVRKYKKSKDPVGGTEAVDVVHNRGPASDLSPVERPTFVNGDHLSDNAEQGSKTDGKEESKMKKLDCSPSVTDVKADDVIQDVLESLKQCENGPANAEKTDNRPRKRKKKSSTVVAPPELEGEDDVDHRDPTVLVHNVSEVSASSKSTRKTVMLGSNSAVQLNGSDLGSNRDTIKPQYDGRLIEDVVSVDHSKSTRVDNHEIDDPCGNGRVKSQQKHEIVNSGKIIIDKAARKTGVETVVKGKKNSKPGLSSKMLNGNQGKEAKAQAAKSSSIQSQRSSSKVEPSSSNVKSNKPLLTISESAAKEPLQPNKSDKIDSTPKSTQGPINVNSSRSSRDLKKNNPHAVSSSALETPKSTPNLKNGGNGHRLPLDIAKAIESNSRKVGNNLANKKNLLGTTGTIFGHDDKESSDDEDGIGNSDSSAKTPSDSSSSSDSSGNSHVNGSSSPNGSYNSKCEKAGGRDKPKPGSSNPKSMSLHAILRNSSSYKKAKLTASQAIDSQSEEFVPDSQAP